MNDKLKKSAEKVQEALIEKGVDFKVIELKASTRTAKEAAEAVGAKLGQIAKSLVFMGEVSQSPLLVIASGKNRVNLDKIEPFMNEPLKMADPDFVREVTGFVIGGVPPIGHKIPIKTVIDKDLLKYDEIWAAAGTPHSLFRLEPIALERLTGGIIAPVV